MKRFGNAALILVGLVVCAVLGWVILVNGRSGAGREDGNAGRPLAANAPAPVLRYRDLLPAPDGRPMPTIEIGFVDESHEPVSLERVEFGLGYLRPLDPTVDMSKPNGFGGWTLNGYNGFKTGFNIGDGRDMQLRLLMADTYYEVVFGPTEKYEMTSFQTPRYEEGKLEYSVLVVLRERKTVPPPKKSEIHLTGVAPPPVDGISNYLLSYGFGDESAGGCSVDAGERFDVVVSRLGGSLVFMQRDGLRILGYVEAVESPEVRGIILRPIAKTYRLKRPAGGDKEGIILYLGEKTDALMGGCGFDRSNPVETTLSIAPGTYWCERIRKDPKTRLDVR